MADSGEVKREVESEEAKAVPAHASVDAASVAAADGAVIEESRRKRRRARNARIAAVAAVAAVLALYIGVASWYSGHFIDHTKIGGYDVSGLTVDEAAAMMGDTADDYTLSVSGEGLDFEVTSAETGLRVDSGAVAAAAMQQNDSWGWPRYLLGAGVQDLTDTMQVTFDEGDLESFVKKQVKKANKGAADPVSATIEYDEDAGGFVVVPEEPGTKLDVDAVLDKVENAALAMETSVQIGEGELVQADLLSGDERLAAACEAADDMIGVDLQLTLDGLDWLEVNSKRVASWIRLDDDVKPYVDDDAVRKWAGKQVDKVNSVGAKRTFTTPGGTEVEVSGGSYGWEVDSEAFITALEDAVADKASGELEVPCVQVAAAIPDDDGVDFGKKYVEVNLTTQHAIFYNGKKVLWESDFISGADDKEHATPTGVYYVDNKESPSKLVGEMQPVEKTTGKGKNKKTVTTYEPEYETTVTYWMPFVGNSIGFHDATWQPAFGGTMYQEGYGSHGCINLPLDAAEELYDIIKVGTPVIVHK